MIQSESELTGICGIMIRRRDIVNGYLWDYDTQERESERVPVGL